MKRLALLLLASCHYTIAPPLQGDRLCGKDEDCHPDEHCWYRTIDTRAVCLPGAPDSFTDFMRRPDAGRP